ncbi:MAG: glycosyltransferase family 4 protein [Candidatus Levyibacteriota bacterium]|nr:MAG: glycosyltransferase family 4 protein [Candidatus Levybacteria bacterium]
MLIGIDGNEANVERRVGISEYSFELLKKFEEFQISNFKFQIYLKNYPLIYLPKEHDGWKYKVIGPKKLWTQIALPFDLYFHKPRPDVFFSPTHYAPRFSPVPTVISIMDLSYIRFPEMFKKSDLYQLRNWTSYSVNKAKKIFTISQASKNDIIKLYGISEGKVIVTYPGVRHKTAMQNSKIKEKYGIKEDYILFVGTLQPRKNIVRLIEAFSKIQDKDIDLVIVGKKGWMYEDILQAPKKYNVENRVKFLEFVSNEELQEFYKHAVCFILPSLYEGFGLPILEAMQYGCPVITSNVSSLPEAGGEAAIYVNPEDVDDMAKKIEMVISNKKIQEELREKGYKQAKKFSWERAAKETLKVLEEVANAG